MNRQFQTSGVWHTCCASGSMTKPRRKDNGAAQNVGRTIAATVDRDVLAQRAYELYLARGAQDGRDLDDWLAAERELQERRALQLPRQ
jgi:DUF2934 family protein